MITLEEIRTIHSRIMEIDRTNQDDYIPGERYIAIIESMLEYKMGDDKSVFYNAAVALHTIASRHPFYNGNKRTACTTALMILKNEGINLTVNKEDRIQFIIDIATPEKGITVEIIEKWLINNSKIDENND